MTKLKLTIEFIPSSSWHNNLRNLLKPKMWDDIRKKVYQKRNFKCDICGEKRKLQAHEIWEFNQKNLTQKLIDITPLCFMCHMVKHMGFAGIMDRRQMNERLIRHFMDVNKVDRLVFQKHLKEEIKKFEDRSKYEWQLDLENLKRFQ